MEIALTKTDTLGVAPHCGTAQILRNRIAADPDRGSDPMAALAAEILETKELLGPDASALPRLAWNSPGGRGGSMSSLDDCPQTAPQPSQERLACLGSGGCFASESAAGFDRNASLLCVGTRIRTAKLNDLDPVAWLTDVLERIVSGQTKQDELHALLPWKWKTNISSQAISSAWTSNPT
jgi:hypothetical protein